MKDELFGFVQKLKGSEIRSKKAGKFFKILFNNSPIGIYIVQDGKFRFVNPQFQKLTGYSKDELLGTNSLSLVLPKDRNMVRENAAKMLKGEISSAYEYRIIKKSGEVGWIMETVAPIQNLRKKIALGNFMDITQSKRTETVLETERQRIFSLLDGLPALAFLQAEDYSIFYANRYFREQIGEPKGKSCYEILRCYKGHKSSCEGCLLSQVLLSQVFDTKSPREWEFNQFDNRTYHIYAYPFSGIDDIPLVLVLGIDITERKHFKQEMARLDRLNLVGEMAASIGHEIRNPMTTVRGYLQLLGDKKDFFHYKDRFELMISELDRANDIISNFLTVAKNKKVDLKLININDIVKAMFPLIQADAFIEDKNIILELENTTDLFLDEKEIRQLILNLARNGLEAMPPGGVLTLKTFLEDKEVVLAVQDHGKGIEPEILKKIGTPFFTTKDNGTGLGLAVCHSIAARHNACINIETCSEGTTFYVKFKHNQALPLS